jgi:hypothetical protein
MVSHPRDSKLEFLVHIEYTRFYLIPLDILEEVLADIQADGQASFCMICSFQAFYMVNIQDWITGCITGIYVY